MRFLALPALLGLASAPVFAQEVELDTTRWSPALSMQYRAVGGVELSPDGSRVAYTVREAIMEGEKSEYLTHIWMAAVDGSFDIQYTHGEQTSNNPQFSPNGVYLAFTSSRSGENQVWRMRVMGGEAEQVTKADPGVGAYQWSPDGTRLAYTMRDPDTEE